MSKNFKYWQVKYKEYNKPEQVKEYFGYLTEKELIAFFGLEDPEIEWYNIKEFNYRDSIY